MNRGRVRRFLFGDGSVFDRDRRRFMRRHPVWASRARRAVRDEVKAATRDTNWADSWRR